MNKKVEDLIEAAKGEKDVLDFIEMELKAFPDYVSAVYNHVILARMARFRFEGSDLVAYLEGLDRKRKNAHDCAIGACNALNRLCDKYGVAPCCCTKTEIRHEVANFTGAIVAETYFDGIGTKTMDELIEYLEANPKEIRKMKGER